MFDLVFWDFYSEFSEHFYNLDSSSPQGCPDITLQLTTDGSATAMLCIIIEWGEMEEMTAIDLLPHPS